jgi:hypothetical protein
MNKANIQEQVAALKTQHEKVKALAAFLDLKQAELRPGDEISFFGILEAKEQLAIEQSVLSGHAGIVQEFIQKKRVPLDADSQRMLRQIQAQARQLAIL